MALADELKTKINTLKTLEVDRKEHEEKWKDALEYVLPQKTRFMGALVEDKRFETTSTQNVHKLADGMFGSNCPQAINWFKFRFIKDALNDDKEAMIWIQDAQQKCYDAINRSNYYDVLPILLRYGCAFETAAMSVYENVKEGTIICNPLQIDEIYIQVTTNNEIYRIFRKFKMSADQAMIEFGDANSLKVKDAAAKNTKMEIECIHIVEKRTTIDKTKTDTANMQWRSIYIDNSNEHLITDSGFRKSPFMIWRFEVRGNSPYGYGPTTDAMPDIYTANTMRSDFLKASQKALDPPVFFPEEKDWSMDAGSENYYEDSGRQAYTVKSFIDSPLTLELLVDVREAIKASYKAEYFMPLMQLADKQMTAREVFERKSERVTATGSIQGRLTTEVITPFLERVFQIEYDAGRIEPVPESLAAEQIKIDYLSPLAQEQREVANAQGILASLDMALPLMQIWPETKDKIKPEVLVDKIFDNTGMPEEAIKTDKEYNDIQEAKAVQQNEMIALQKQQVQAEIAAKASQAINQGG